LVDVGRRRLHDRVDDIVDGLAVVLGHLGDRLAVLVRVLQVVRGHADLLGRGLHRLLHDPVAAAGLRLVDGPARGVRQLLLRLRGAVGVDGARGRFLVDLLRQCRDDRVHDRVRVDAVIGRDLRDRLPALDLAAQLVRRDADRGGGGLAGDSNPAVTPATLTGPGGSGDRGAAGAGQTADGEGGDGVLLPNPLRVRARTANNSTMSGL